MININLKTGGSSDGAKMEWGKALPLAIGLLVIIGVVYAVVIFYTKKYDNGIKAAQGVYDQKLDDLKKGNAKNVFDFQNRITESKKMLEKNTNTADNLKEIEKYMIPGVYLNSYEFDSEKRIINLECIASNYNDVAKQIFNFKKSTYFSEVSAGETSLSGQDGKVSFEVDLTIK